VDFFAKYTGLTGAGYGLAAIPILDGHSFSLAFWDVEFSVSTAVACNGNHLHPYSLHLPISRQPTSKKLSKGHPMHRCLLPTLALAFLIATVSLAADNQLTDAEKDAGWKLLFNGKDLAGWRCNNDKPIATKIEDGCLVPYQSGGYLIIHEGKFDDFILKCDVRWLDPQCNSGVFFRLETPRDPVNTSFEAQVMAGSGTGKHDMGALYDLVAPSKAAGNPTGEWNAIEVKCQGPNISVKVNGTLVSELDCDKFDKPGFCPDGQPHKFKLNNKPRAIKDFARTGYLGFQDHGHKVWYKNVKVLELKK
jgi:hypothetical protein